MASDARLVRMLVATLVTLVIVPVLYVIFVEDLHLVRWETEAPAEPNHQPAVAAERAATAPTTSAGCTRSWP